MLPDTGPHQEGGHAHHFVKTPASQVVSGDLHLMSHLVHTCCHLDQYAYTGTCSLCIWQKASHICLLQTRPPPSSIMLCRYRYNVFSDTKHRMNHGENVSANSHYSKEAMYNTASYLGLGIMSYAFNQYPPRSHVQYCQLLGSWYNELCL